MKITYNENPLCTTVELDDHEKEMFRLKLKLKEYEEILYDAYFHLQEGKDWFSLEQARKSLDADRWCTDEKSPVDTHVDNMFECYIAELQSIHSGDCTSFPASCTKCHAEELLGISTISGLDKSMGHRIFSLFLEEGCTTAEEAITALLNFTPKYSTSKSWHSLGEESFNSYIPIWKDQSNRAAAWLKNYRETYL